MSGRGHLVLDIETVPDRALWEPPPPKEGEKPPFPPAFAHRVVVVGTLLLDDAWRPGPLEVRGGETAAGGHRDGAPGGACDDLDGDEARLLSDCAAMISSRRPHLVTWNGRAFDLPVLALRCLRHGVPFPVPFERGGDEAHLDLHDALSAHRAARGLGLDAAARLVGLPGKLGVDGSHVEGLWSAGQREAVRRYCLSDVAQTALLRLRFALLAGQLAPPAYRDAAAALLATLDADGRLADLCQKIDRARLLIAGAAPPAP